MLGGDGGNPEIASGFHGSLADGAPITALDEKADITDEGKLKKAIGILCRTARDVDLKTLDQFAALDFYQLLDKGDIAVGGLKDMLDVYGMDIDKFLNSVEAKTVTAWHRVSSK